MSSPDVSGLKGQPLPQRPALQRFLGSTAVAVALYAAVMALIVHGSFVGAQNMGYNWQWHRVPQFLYSFTDDGFQLGEIFYGLFATIQLSATAFALATVLGLLVALLRLSGLVMGTAGSIGFLELIRNCYYTYYLAVHCDKH